MGKIIRLGGDRVSLVIDLFERAIREIKENYPNYQFMTHRDVAWMLQREIKVLIEKEGYPFEVYHSYPLGRERPIIKDYELVIVARGVSYRNLLSGEASVELVVRLLFEPSRHRQDICEYSLPYVLSPRIATEIKELRLLRENRLAKETRFILIDECSRHNINSIEWKHQSWGDYGDSRLNVSVLEVV